MEKTVGTQHIPLWPELGLDRIWKNAMKIPEFKEHMPDDWVNAPKKRERDFFYGVLSTLQEDYVRHLISDCRRQRIAAL